MLHSNLQLYMNCGDILFIAFTICLYTLSRIWIKWRTKRFWSLENENILISLKAAPNIVRKLNHATYFTIQMKLYWLCLIFYKVFLFE